LRFKLWPDSRDLLVRNRVDTMNRTIFILIVLAAGRAAAQPSEPQLSRSNGVIPHVDIVNQSGSVGKCVPVPLDNLVYHDAVLISYGAGRSGGEKNLLQGILKQCDP
jgi:hypothetical protein